MPWIPSSVGDNIDVLLTTLLSRPLMSASIEDLETGTCFLFLYLIYLCLMTLDEISKQEAAQFLIEIFKYFERLID